MKETTAFIKDRAVKTIAASKSIAATWVYADISIADYEAQLQRITGNKAILPVVIGQEEIEASANQSMLGARGVWDVALDQLHRWTVQGVGLAKNKFRNDPAKLVQLADLSARGMSRKETLAEALTWESAWADVDAAWKPLPLITLAAFKALRKQCNEDLQNSYNEKRSEWRTAAETLSAMAADLEDVNEAWYSDATRVFAAGTPEGDMIRGTIPTTYNPPAEDKPTVPPVV